MQRVTKTVLLGAAAFGAVLGSYGVASAATGVAGQESVAEAADDGPNEAKDSDTPLAGSELDRAVAAALEHTSGGEVTDTEVGDDGAAFSVEIRLGDGSQVEVNLDAEFVVIGSEADAD